MGDVVAIDRQRKNVSYGLSQALVGIPASPVVSSRAPTSNDKAEIGTTWVNKTTNSPYILTSIVANSATWTITSASGTDLTVTSLTVEPGDLNVITGDILVSDGDITITDGALIIDLGGILLQSGGIILTKGNISLSDGDLTLTDGDFTLTLGNLDVVSGRIDSSSHIISSSGDIIASNGNISAGKSLFVGGDDGGVAGKTAFTNVVDTSLDTGDGAVKMRTTNPGNSSGWMKIYVGTGVRYVPFWTNISP